jgi:hypothetical protein
MSLIEQNKQVTNGSVQLNAVEPKFEMRAKTLYDQGRKLEFAASVLSYIFIVGLIDEAYRGISYLATANNYDQLCQKFAKLHFEIQSADGKNVSNIITEQNKIGTELRGRVVKAISLGNGDIADIKEAAQYKLQQAICKQQTAPDADVEDTDPKVRKAAVKASGKLIEDLDTRIARDKVNEYVEKNKFRLDEAELDDLAADLDVAPGLVREIAGKKLHKDIGSGKEGERKLKEAKKLLRGEELSNAVEADVKKQLKKLEKAVSERSEAISKYKEANKAIKAIKQKEKDLAEELEGSLETSDVGLHKELQEKEDELDELIEKLGGDDKKSKSKTDLEKEIKELKQTISEKENELHKLTKNGLGLQKTLKECEKAHVKAEDKYAKLIKELFGITARNVNRGDREKVLKDKVVDAIREAGKLKGKDDNGKMKFHKLPGNLEGKIVKKALKQKFIEKDEDRVALANRAYAKAKFEADIAKARKDVVEISPEKRAKYDYQAQSTAGYLSTLLGGLFGPPQQPQQ